MVVECNINEVELLLNAVWFNIVSFVEIDHNADYISFFYLQNYGLFKKALYKQNSTHRMFKITIYLFCFIFLLEESFSVQTWIVVCVE